MPVELWIVFGLIGLLWWGFERYASRAKDKREGLERRIHELEEGTPQRQAEIQKMRDMNYGSDMVEMWKGLRGHTDEKWAPASRVEQKILEWEKVKRGEEPVKDYEVPDVFVGPEELKARIKKFLKDRKEREDDDA